jgi:hypothetical protein
VVRGKTFPRPMNLNSKNFPQRPAWIKIYLGKLRRNLQLIRSDCQDAFFYD